ncbi:carboxypeptidase-like regulatory domain-containing protein [Robertkochia marina]|uniref:Carboxypeptidase-like regulatory domain-containing protein n=1 Tax=Robertkochia marina TaxID=1227945 RepID=A0A4S3M1Y7_9FLAO|nr:carboxypeptidase-like regulatory domain-containing protein [Robertkochia marina]THD67485.1 carboxypeptidase-like regulatory domain-containing protein [Robertkochia marina]TRZ44698.1 carboxypeptidase-like regulatory domain-containing protein [Robertkochia marina]
MKRFLLIATLFFFASAHAQDPETLRGKVVNAENGVPLNNVHVVNLNQVVGTITNEGGNFEISAQPNDTLYFSFIGFKTIQIRVTNDMLKFQNTEVQLTELAYALEQVTIRPFQLTGYLEIDSKNIPVNTSRRYSISGLDLGYEAGDRNPGAFARAMGSIFNPADLLYNLFGSKPKQMKKLRKMKEDDEIRNLLSSKFDRQTLAALLQVEKNEIDEILRNCSYSDSFIQTANDLQILDAISQCYEEYKVLNRNN